MNVLLLGAGGQLGWEVQRTCPQGVRLAACDFPEVNFLNLDSIFKCIELNNPDCIINAAAYTAVDKAEQEAELAFKINYKAVRDISEICRVKNIRLIHISTDYVFCGRAYKPYQPDEETNPQSVYGESKLKGENAVKNILDDFLIIRTAWLYSSHGSNFVKTMLRLMGERQELSVVDDQIGTPTWAKGLAQAVWLAFVEKIQGTFHWTDAGTASWYDFAMAIQEEAFSKGLLKKKIPIYPIPSSAYPTPAQRPMYGLLDKRSFWEILKCSPVHWRVQLCSMLEEIKL